MEFGDPRLHTKFWKKVQVNSDGSWTWAGRLNAKGYGIYAHSLAHRVLFLAAGCDIPPGWHVGHRCHDEAVEAGLCDGGVNCEHRACVTLSHLEAQSPRENTRAGNARAGRQSRQGVAACGHPFSTAPSGRRYCRPCLLKKGRDRTAFLTAAAHHLGLTHRQYVTEYGSSLKVAQQHLNT